MGDVKIGLLIKKDGSIESTWVIAGPPMLIQAALDSVNKSKFECRACQEDSMPYTVTYTYNIPEEPTVKPDPCCCTYIPGRDNTPHPPTVTQSGNHITVSAEVPCICPDQCGLKRVEEDSKYRSFKCLYLWKCGNHHYGVM